MQTQQGNCRYQTSPALCNSTAPFEADRLHPLLQKIFRILFALASVAWHTKWSISVAWRYWRLNDPFAANAAATAAEKIANDFEWPGQPPKIAPFPWGSAPPSNTWFCGPIRVFIRNGISIGSAVFAQLTVVSHYFAMRRYIFPLKLPFPWVIPWYPGPTRVVIANGISIGSALSAVSVWVPNAL